MGNLKSLIVAGVAAAMLAGCNGMQLQEAKRATPTGSDFSKSLYGEYVKLSQGEYNEGDYRDSDNFANSAIAAAGGSPTEPEAIASRGLPGDKVGELSGARDRLVKALSAGAREKMPAKAANAQAMFDCWMQEQEENFQPKDIARCRADFMKVVAELEDGLKPTPVAAKPEPAPAPAPMVKRYVVYFPFDSDRITAQSADVVRQAIDEAKALGGARVSLVGNTDTVGTQQYNLGLSNRRVESIVEAMKSGGLSPRNMDLTALGESNLPVQTPDNVKNQENRRVQIVITK